MVEYKTNLTKYCNVPCPQLRHNGKNIYDEKAI